MIAVTVDIVVLTRDLTKVVLIQRGNEPYKNRWALPGGFLDENDKSLRRAAERELHEETGIQIPANNSVWQVGAWGSPDRDPRGYTVTVAYLTLLDAPVPVEGGDDARRADWIELPRVPTLTPENFDLAFDHVEIINRALIMVE